MDISRGVLDNLMGRDRNMPKNSKHTRDHYSNSDVCKPFLVCFCFNTLFPNTIYDEGPCNKRHDTYLKTMFDSDMNRAEYERDYIKDCIVWIERRLIDAQQKTKKNQNVIETKTSFPTDRPKQILDRIVAIDKDIEDMMKQAQEFGQIGQIDDSSRCLQQVERLRERRRQIQLMGDNLLNVVKQQKICEICGAIQTINDTEKRIQTHLEGKIHQGFLKLRNQIQTLKIRLEIIQHKIEKSKPQVSSALAITNEAEKQKQKQKQRQKQRQREKEKQKQRQKQKQKQKQKQRQRERERQKQKQTANRDEKQRERSRSKKKKDREKERGGERKDRKNSRDRKDRDRSKQRRGGDDRQDREQRSRSRHKKSKDRDNKKDKKHKRDKSYERDYRDKYNGFEKKNSSFY